MTEKKEENCQTQGGCGCCSGVKQLIIGLLLGALIFAFGYFVARGGCPFGSKICPLMQR